MQVARSLLPFRANRQTAAIAAKVELIQSRKTECMPAFRCHLFAFVVLLPLVVAAEEHQAIDFPHYDNLMPLTAADSEMTSAEWSILRDVLPSYQSPAKGDKKEPKSEQVSEAGFSAVASFSGVGNDTNSNYPVQTVVFLERGNEVMTLSLYHGLSPICLMTGTNVYNLMEEGEEWLRLTDIPWRSFLDGRHLQAQTSVSSEITGGVSGFETDLPNWAVNKLQSLSPQRSWLRTSRTLRLQADRGAIEFRFRTPEDALRYGTPVAAIRFISADSPEMVIVECLQYGHVVPLYASAQPRWPADQFSVKTIAVPDGGRLVVKLNQTPETGRLHEESRRMLISLQEAARPTSSPTILESYKKWEDLYHIMAETTDQSKVKSLIADPSLANARAENLISQLDALCDTIVIEEGQPICDPAMIAWKAESEISSWFLHRSLNSAVVLLACDNLADDIEYSLLDAIGDLGHPAFYGTGNYLSCFRKQPDPVAEAIVFSRWGWPCEREQIDACLAALKSTKAGGRGERVLVETLIRADQTKLVPAEALARWISAEILHNQEVKRQRAAAVMTAAPSGRVALLASPEVAQATVPLRSTVIAALRSRVEATQQIRMWLFMNEAECGQALTWLRSMESQE